MFFQDFGLLAYGPDGEELWRMPLGPFNNPFGHGASPILSGDTLLMNCDQDTNSFLLAIDKNTGRIRWRTERAPCSAGLRNACRLPGSRRHATGDCRGILSFVRLRSEDRQGNLVHSPPSVADQTDSYRRWRYCLFSTWAGESEPGEQEKVPAFEEALAKLDKNQDGKLGKDEMVDPKARCPF